MMSPGRERIRQRAPIRRKAFGHVWLLCRSFQEIGIHLWVPRISVIIVIIVVLEGLRMIVLQGLGWPHPLHGNYHTSSMVHEQKLRKGYGTLLYADTQEVAMLPPERGLGFSV